MTNANDYAKILALFISEDESQLADYHEYCEGLEIDPTHLSGDIQKCHVYAIAKLLLESLDSEQSTLH